jgi:type IV pilus assembly protein PilB
MAAPTPNDPKKPTVPSAGQKPAAAGTPPSKNPTPAGGTPKAASGGAKPPAPPKPVAAAAGGAPPPKKPTPAKNRFSHIDSNTRQLAQKFVDLGFMDDAQLEAIYE